MADTGHLTTLTCATSSYAPVITAINGFDCTRPSIDVSHLSTDTYRDYIPGDLVATGSFTIEGHQLIGTSEPPIDAAAETITITLPEITDTGDPPDIAGSGFFTSFTTGSYISDNLQTFTAEIQWSTYPTFTAETDA